MPEYPLNGLHLWSLKLKNADTSLWITTKKRDIEAAIRKGRRFLRRNIGEFGRSAEIKGADYNGTIDA